MRLVGATAPHDGGEHKRILHLAPVAQQRLPVETALRAQSRALSSAADEILQRDPVNPAGFQPLWPPEAVLM